MAYIIDILKGTIQPLPDHISLERYVVESSNVTKYLSRVVKDKALSVYHVLFHLSWFETGKGEIVIPWAGVGAFIRSEQGNIIDDASTVKRHLSNLFERDYYNDPSRRLTILARDGNTCVFCTAAITEDTFVLDHLLPVAKGVTNRKHNLVAACEVCNRRRGESEPIVFLRDNYRQQLITQEEFLRQKGYIEQLLTESTG